MDNYSALPSVADNSSLSNQLIFTSSNKRKYFEDESEASNDGSDKEPKTKTSDTRTCNGETKTAEELLFSNDLLLSLIFQFSTFQDLKSFRQVNRLWNLEATKSQRKHFLTRRLGIWSQTVVFPDIYGRKITSLNFRDFSEFASESALFPCTSFEFHGPIENMIEGEHATFFKAHGHLVKEFIASFKTITEFNLPPIETFISEHLPNLEILIAEHDPEVPFTDSTATESTLSSSIKLKKLSTVSLVYEVTMPLVKHFLKIAPNLKSIFWHCIDHSGFNFDHMTSIIDLNAMRLLKTGILLFQNHSVEILQKVLQHSPAFEEITVLNVNDPLTPKHFKMATEILTEMLYQCRNTIRSFLSFYPVGHLEGLILPVFPNVEEIYVVFYESMCYNPPIAVPILPAGVNFSKTFPNLKVFEFQFSEVEEIVEVEVIFLETLIPLLSVTEISIFGDDRASVPIKWMEQFCTLFPNVRKASFTTMWDYHFEYIWALPFVEELELAYAVDVQNHSFPFVDSTFTGFSPTTCNELYTRSPEDNIFSGSDSYFNNLYVKPSIGNLDRLKKLTIKFVDDRFVDVGIFDIRKNYRSIVADSQDVSRDVLKVNDKVIMSHVTKKFLLAMFPKLHSNVTIQFNVPKVLMTF